MLTLTRTGTVRVGPRLPRRDTRSRARSLPMSRIRPVDSATLMNAPGRSSPRVGWRQRTSASTPRTVVVVEPDERLVPDLELVVRDRLAQLGLDAAPVPGPRPRCRGRTPRCRRGRSAWPGTSRSRRPGSGRPHPTAGSSRCRSDAVTTISVSPTRMGACSERRIRSAIATASSMSVTSSLSTRNSSPFDRATVSWLRAVAAEAARDLGRAPMSPAPCAERVVDVLEVVDVQEQDRGRAAGSVIEVTGEPVGEQPTVGQAGQSVVEGDAPQLGLVALAVGDVRDHVQDVGRLASSAASSVVGQAARS